MIFRIGRKLCSQSNACVHLSNACINLQIYFNIQNLKRNNLDIVDGFLLISAIIDPLHNNAIKSLKQGSLFMKDSSCNI